MILGSLTIGLNAIHILQPPEPPYNGFSVKGLFQKLREIRVPHFCQMGLNYRRKSYYNDSEGNCEGFGGPLERKTRNLKDKLEGFSL